jgi:hypothetical protein
LPELLGLVLSTAALVKTIWRSGGKRRKPDDTSSPARNVSSIKARDHWLPKRAAELERGLGTIQHITRAAAREPAESADALLGASYHPFSSMFCPWNATLGPRVGLRHRLVIAFGASAALVLSGLGIESTRTFDKISA